MENARIAEAKELMLRFADRTGLTSDRPARRYLWTDAFAVCNFVGLARATGDTRYGDLGLRLIDQVHHELGRFRRDDARSGWLSGLPGTEGEAHPTRGGLRIGKPSPERAPEERFDPDLEWERDGQYFHYLTKWMHALDQVARWTGRAIYNGWARELAETAHAAFAYGPPGDRRMVWKMSVDLSRPVVRSMGHHDPLDGFVTCVELDATARALGSRPNLVGESADFAGMLEEGSLTTSDPLGIGGLLVDACRLAQLDAEREAERIRALLAAGLAGVARWVTQADLRSDAEHRLAFRELGLGIGLAAAEMLRADPWRRSLTAAARSTLAALDEFAPLRREIDAFWLRPHHRRSATWLEHQDIDEVMLATSLLPDGFLVLEAPPRDVLRPALPTSSPLPRSPAHCRPRSP